MINYVCKYLNKAYYSAAQTVQKERYILPNNFHTHTNRCQHAYGCEEDYVTEAAEKGLSVLGFSDHAPFPDKDFGYRMQFSELDEYIKEIDRLKTVYKGKLEIYKGLEIEYHPEYFSYYNELYEKHGLDYLALGQHIYTTGSGEVKNIFFAESTDDYLDYARSVCEAIDTGLFTFVAHPDLMFINDIKVDDKALEACRMIVNCASKHGTILEYNANGLRRGMTEYTDGKRYPYPYDFFWKLVREARIKVIVGSDCHSPSQLCDKYFINAIARAKNFGLVLTDSIFSK